MLEVYFNLVAELLGYLVAVFSLIHRRILLLASDCVKSISSLCLLARIVHFFDDGQFALQFLRPHGSWCKHVLYTTELVLVRRRIHVSRCHSLRKLFCVAFRHHLDAVRGRVLGYLARYCLFEGGLLGGSFWRGNVGCGAAVFIRMAALVGLLRIALLQLGRDEELLVEAQLLAAYFTPVF